MERIAKQGITQQYTIAAIVGNWVMAYSLLSAARQAENQSQTQGFGIRIFRCYWLT
jgi:hypothetical protein